MTIKTEDESEVPLIKKFFNYKREKNQKEPVKKVSLFQLFRYGNSFDFTLMIIGGLVAIVTGMGMPFLSIIMGNMSQSFINMTALIEIENGNQNVTFDPSIHNYTTDKFSDDVIDKVMWSVYMGIGLFLSALIQVTCFLVASENMMHRMRLAFFKSVLRQNIAWYDINNSGTLATKLFDNLERIKEGTGDKVALAIQFTAQFFGGFAIAFTYDWKLTLIMMSLSPLMILTGVFLAKLMSESTSKEAKQYAVAGAIAEEALTSLRTVYAFNGQNYECQRYNKALDAGKLNGVIKSAYVGAGLALTFLVMFGSYCLAFWVGTNFVVDKYMDAETLITVFFSIMMGSMALGQAGPQFAVIGTAQGAASAIYEIIDREPEIDSYSDEGVKLSKISGHLTVSNIKFSYPSRPDIPILKGIGFEALPGETVALVGSSGCGKSTIVQLLLRYYNSMEGEIKLDGHNITDLNINCLRKAIGVVSQEPILFNCTIEENIKFGNSDVTDHEMRTACRMANADNFISSLPLGYKTMVGERGVQLSGGQKQRIAIARALVRNPKILLLDEATSALDAESEFVVQKALDIARQGRTTIVIAHRLSTIKNADKIVAIKNGEVEEVGTHDDLIAKQGLYYNLVNAQVFADVDAPRIHADSVRSVARSRRSSTSSSKLDPLSPKFDVDDESDEDNAETKDAKSELKRLQRDLEKEGARPRNLFAILKYARPEVVLIIIAVIASIVQGTVFPAFSLVFTNIMEVFANSDPNKMRKDGHFWAIMFLVLGIVMGVSLFFQALLFGTSAERLTMRIRSKLFRNILRQDVAYFDMPTHSSGKLCTRLASDAPNVKSAIDYRLGSVFSAIVSVGAGICIAFYFNWQMALLVIAIFPLGAVGQALELKYAEGRGVKDAKDMENAGKVALEAIENIRTVQALTLEKRFYVIFEEYLEFPHRTSLRKAIIQGLTYGFSSSIFFFLYAAAFRFGVWLIVKNYNTSHQIMPMDVLRTLYAISFTAGSMGFASAYFPEYIKAKLAAGLIFKMLEENPAVDNLSDEGLRARNIQGHVNFKNIIFSYPQRTEVQVLKGINVEAKPGETIALVGSSGCGKSTVVSLLERFYEPLSGEVSIDGTNIREYGLKDMRSQISLVSQEPILFDRSIKENIFYGLTEDEKSEQALFEAARLANIHNFVAGLPDQYDTRVGEKGAQLSGGQKQRIAIARALIRNPKILLLDEATSALDTESEKVVQEALDRAREGRTCIVIAHRLSTIVNADCIAVVKDGVIIEKGTHSELMAQRGAYFALTEKQNAKKS
uniref:p-glycoprotein n=1 Tax=Panagrolaimus sp. PS1159 TaxID=55785 RepID=A0AC35FBA3_9BILA